MLVRVPRRANAETLVEQNHGRQSDNNCLQPIFMFHSLRVGWPQPIDGAAGSILMCIAVAYEDPLELPA